MLLVVVHLLSLVSQTRAPSTNYPRTSCLDGRSACAVDSHCHVMLQAIPRICNVSGRFSVVLFCNIFCRLKWFIDGNQAKSCGQNIGVRVIEMAIWKCVSMFELELLVKGNTNDNSLQPQGRRQHSLAATPIFSI